MAQNFKVNSRRSLSMVLIEEFVVDVGVGSSKAHPTSAARAIADAIVDRRRTGGRFDEFVAVHGRDEVIIATGMAYCSVGWLPCTARRAEGARDAVPVSSRNAIGEAFCVLDDPAERRTIDEKVPLGTEDIAFQRHWSLGVFDQRMAFLADEDDGCAVLPPPVKVVLGQGPVWAGRKKAPSAEAESASVRVLPGGH